MFSDCGFFVNVTDTISNQTLDQRPSSNISAYKNCLWNLEAQSGQKINVSFESFSTEVCCSYVEVRMQFCSTFVRS